MSDEHDHGDHGDHGDEGVPTGASDRAQTSGDDVQRRFREALERKKAGAGGSHGSQRSASRAVGPASNDKTKRQFRRKSG